jgi:hypothetical protein
LTISQNATVPVKPAGLKRLIITMVFTLLSALFYLVKLIIKNRKKREQAIAAEEE